MNTVDTSGSIVVKWTVLPAPTAGGKQELIKKIGDIIKAAVYSVVVTVLALWMQVSYPLFGRVVKRLDNAPVENRTQALLAVAMTLAIQIGLLGALVILL